MWRIQTTTDCVYVMWQFRKIVAYTTCVCAKIVANRCRRQSSMSGASLADVIFNFTIFDICFCIYIRFYEATFETPAPHTQTHTQVACCRVNGDWQTERVERHIVAGVTNGICLNYVCACVCVCCMLQNILRSYTCQPRSTGVNVTQPKVTKILRAHVDTEVTDSSSLLQLQLSAAA